MNPSSYLNCYPISEATSYGYRPASVLPSQAVGVVTTSNVAGVNTNRSYYNSAVLPTEPITSTPFYHPLPHPLFYTTTCR